MSKVITEDKVTVGLASSENQVFVQSPAFQKVYSNNVQLGMSIFDMNLTFGEIIGNTEDGQPVIEQKLKINMSKEFMKALQNLLNKNIGEFEKRFGEIEIISLTDIVKVEVEVPKKPVKKRTAKKK